MKYTINDFRKHFNTDAKCLDKIFQLRYGKLEACPDCACVASFRRITTRRAYQCRHCYAQFYPTAGTVFEKTTTPLSDWFYVIYLFTATRNGLAAKEIERQLGVTYKTAWRMGHQIRKLIGGILPEQLKGFVEIDETYVGGKATRNTRASEEKTAVFGMVERTGSVKAVSMDKIQQSVIFGLIKENVSPDAKVNTDEFPIYKYLRRDTGVKNHKVIKHNDKVYRKGDVTTNTIEGYFSQLKRTIYGSHIHVSGKYLQNYVNEVSFRYNYRKKADAMFDVILSRLPENKME